MGRVIYILLCLLLSLTNCKNKVRDVYDQTLYLRISLNPEDSSEVYQMSSDTSMTLRKSYWDGHILMSEFFYRKNIPNGPFKLFHPNGKLATQGQYNNGLLSGYTVDYDEAGRIESKLHYKSGKEEFKILFDSMGTSRDTLKF